LELVVSRCEGDVRSAINDLQSVAERTRSIRAVDFENLVVRDKQLSIQETLRGIFLAESPLQARRAQSHAEVDYEMLHQTIHDNLPLQYTDPEDLAAGYESMSHADVFLGRVERTRDWGLLSYALEQMSVGVAAARRRKYPPVSYRFPPSKLVLLSRLRSQRKLRDDICSSVGVKCHVSRRRANEDFLPFLRTVFKNDEKMSSEMAGWLNLTPEMAAYLSEKPLAEKSPPRGRTKKAVGMRGGRGVG
jgi:replication factor C large subunit